jgi:flagellar protein FliL
VKAASKVDPKAVPAFVPLDPFTVNLADRDADRYAQIGITLEVDDAKTGDQIKNYMPAIRNNILMAIADRTAGELLGRDGKAQLAERLRRETARALGYEVGDDEAAADEDEEEEKPKKKKKKSARKPAVVLPIKAVHFSNFIIQ